MTDFSRREFGGFVAKTAVAGTIVWTVPTIVSIDTAGASMNRHSAAPKPISRNPGRVESSQLPTPPAAIAETGQLPFTSGPEARDAAIGAAVAVAGVALVVATHEPRTAP